ncbi:MAG TPA: PilC/PilY family type IV pilus protein, partial [Nitrospiria bacterium]|nr:PilC/PilY family type IV pilus protein [Nitrospiria bacterium]
IPSAIMDYAHTAAQHGTSVHCGVAAGCTANITAGAGAPPKHSNTSAALHSTMWDHHDNCSNYYGGPTSDPCTGSGGHYLDDVAYWAHTTDLRPDIAGTPIGTINQTAASAVQPLAGVQNITLYTFFAFGTGSNLLKDAAMVGAFNDLDGDGKPFKDNTCGTASPNPLCKEWDANGDGVPDTYFEGANAFTMRDQLMAAITDILKRSASGTSVSILSTTQQGEGELYQAYFYPSKFEGLNNIQWLGYLQGLFLDSMGNLREDSNQNHALDLTTDKIIKLVFDPIGGQTMVQRFDDANGDGTPDSTTPSSIVTLDQIQPIWEAGKLLALRDDTDRKIYTWVDSNNDGVVTPSEFISFDSTQAALLRPYLNTATTTLATPDPANPDATNVINFIRGANITGYRNRCVTVAGASAQAGCTGTQRVWKMGDIIYSTPVTVGRPKEQYDLVYKDSSYQQFLQQYQTRRDVVYVGANDGMLHAFNAGTYDSTTRIINPGTNFTLGQEMWGFIPYNLLPHLRWLTDPNYTHVFYVDLKPKVVDAKIFTADADHPGGWGTVLIGGLRFGGGAINVMDNFGSGVTTRPFKSSYYALDITNPDKPPVLLWSSNNVNMGFTTSYPAVARVANSLGSSKWVVIMGSGPTLYDGERVTTSPNLFSGADSQGHLYVFDLATGTLLKRIDTGNSNNEFLGDVTTLDGNLDYGVDTVYVGSAYRNGTAWNGNLYRVVTNNNTDPTNWNLSTLYTATGPILEAPSISIDTFSNIWVYFGSGRFLSATSPVNDKADTSQQAMYGIKEGKMCWLGGTAGCPGSAVTYSQLLDASAVQVKTDGTLISGASNDAATTFTQLVTDSRSSFKGWVLNFPSAGERVLAKPIVIGGIVLFSTFTPTNDVCGFQGEGRLYALYFETGTAYSKPVIGSDSVTGKVTRDTDLGQGVPSMAGLHVGAEEGVRGFVQQGTGSISEVDGEPPFKFKSGVMTWQEKQM